ncbi:hypothetical protein AC249_AIPGENE3096 [Exaiptasia diaphana]|nr:hypothetical protein AC249_AIPGENE3096 [Exaiptasia diaphana]
MEALKQVHLAATHTINKRSAVSDREVPPPTPSYFGCFLGSNLQLLNNTILDDNTNAACEKHCYSMKRMFSATHGDVCGCLKAVPKMEISGPVHEEVKKRVPDSVHECQTPCPGHSTDKCSEKQFCCGGHGSYTVYKVGVLQDFNVDLVKSGFVSASKKTDARHKVLSSSFQDKSLWPKEWTDTDEDTDSKDYKDFMKQVEKWEKAPGADFNAVVYSLLQMHDSEAESYGHQDESHERELYNELKESM